MSEKINWHEYFENNSWAWINEAYENADYTYPVGFHRLRVLKKIMSKYDLKDKKCLDIGCGGGDISLFLAHEGAVVDGIDMTDNMIKIANERKANLAPAIQDRIHFYKENVKKLSKKISDNKYDYIIAFGLIGYIDSDREFLEIIENLTYKNTHLIISCRNRLFNISSVTPNTVNEIDNGNAINLIREINTCYRKPLSSNKSREFLNKVEEGVNNIKKIVNDWQEEYKIEYDDNLMGVPKMQPRSSTPNEINMVASNFGFKSVGLYGIHPHLLLPRMNRMLPPAVFNILSDALTVFEDEPISLVYSSVFINDLVKE